MESIGTQKSKRTTREQLSYFIEFAKKNPNLLANKNDPTSPHRVMDLWSQLADGLNSINGPVRPTIKWKETLTHWKHTLRSRARKLKIETRTTGGGPKSKKKLKEFEERALQCFGAITVDGLADLPTLGISDSRNGSPESSEHEDDFEDFVEEIFLLSGSQPQTTAQPDVSDAILSPTPKPKQPKLKNISTQALLQIILEEIKEKKERDASMFQTITNVQSSLAVAISALAKSAQYLSDSISQHNSSKQQDANDSFSSNDS